MNDVPFTPPTAEVVSVLRDLAFEAIEHQAELAVSYARSTGEAAYRGDEATMVVHMKQLRLCCIEMIKTYKDFMEARDGQDVSSGSRWSRSDRQDQRSGDGVA